MDLEKGPSSHFFDSFKVISVNTENECKTNDHFIHVAVSTTSGLFPNDGLKRVPINQPVKVLLKKAADALGLTDTDGWVARVDDREINPSDSYHDNGLTGEITIDWGPAEGGGGA